MVEYSKVNVKLSDAQLKKLKTAIKNKTGATLRMSLKMFNGNDIPYELLLTTRQKTKLRNAFNNNMSTDLKLSTAHISKIIQSGGFIGRLLGPLLKTGLPLIKNVIKPLAKSVLIPLGLTAAAQQQMWKYIKNIGIWNNNFNNFKRKNERHNENYSRF